MRFKFAVLEVRRAQGVSISGYSTWVKADCPQPHANDTVLVTTIRKIERENDGNHGVQKVYEELRKERKKERKKHLHMSAARFSGLHLKTGLEHR
ncbi:hypothetical protein [Anaeromusa acidaminophila]|uniref:hypothetical protein n=1 Tax=Anaeromusa acidaminophila TaxID=81464 RepID=UPI0012EAF62B|nr:hypothetical protein [Anaeromusa acidaminophila]